MYQTLILHYDAINNTGNGHSNTTTTWKDLSGNNNDISSISGNIGENYIQLTGTQSMQVPLSGNFTDITAEFMVSDVQTTDTTLFNGYGSYTRLISVHVPWSDNVIYFDSSHNSSQSGDGYERISKAIDFDKSQKHTLTFVKSTTEGQSIYLDGNLWVQNATYTRAIGNITGAILGAGSADLASYKWQGKIYSIRIYSKALTQEEILNNYNMDKERFAM